MIIASVTEARRSGLFEHVVATGEFATITYRGRPTAAVLPYPWFAARTRRLAELRELRRISDPVELVAAIRALPPLHEMEDRIWHELRDADRGATEHSKGGQA